MTEEHDIARSEGEGMVHHEEYLEMVVPEGLKPFLTEVKEKFDSDENIWGVREAARVLMKEMEDDRKNELSKFVDDLRIYMKLFLGNEEWEKIEAEGARRNLLHDMTFGGTPG